MRCVKDGGGLGWKGGSKCYTVEEGGVVVRKDWTIPIFGRYMQVDFGS